MDDRDAKRLAKEIAEAQTLEDGKHKLRGCLGCFGFIILLLILELICTHVFGFSIFGILHSIGEAMGIYGGVPVHVVPN